jgi:outer membrane protein
MILSKSGDNILYADKSVDITNDIIAGLNKAYKKGSASDKKK